MKIVINHLGFRPQDSEKKAIVHGDLEYKEFQIVNLTEMGYNEIGPNTQENNIIYNGKLEKVDGEWGPYYIADFSDLKTAGMYLVTLDNKYNSVPFFIREDVFSRTLRKAFYYIHIQRCGQAVPGYHEACHLDDARIRDTGEHVNTTGGWHDAGDLRKWVAHTMLLGISITHLKELLDPKWHTFAGKEGDLLDELRWGNSYFLKVQDGDGLIWHDVAGGVDGDNSDNRWTDNIIGDDDRHINTEYLPIIQWEFIYFQSRVASLFKKEDPEYARTCYQAAWKTFQYMQDKDISKTEDISWAVMALVELYKYNQEPSVMERLKQELDALLDLQEQSFIADQKSIKGFFYADKTKEDFFRSSRDSGMPLIALHAALSLLEKNQHTHARCMRALKDHCDYYAVPMSQTSPFNIIPFGLYHRNDSAETFRIIDGKLTYRFFKTVNDVPPFNCLFGITSHHLSYAVGLTLASRILGDERLAVIARRQVEWIMGGNTENSCLMSGEGINNPYPHSRFLGLIPGGIMNGIGGLEDDTPYLEMNYEMDWRTTEYWSPHVCYYIWAVTLMSEGMQLDAMP